MTQVICGWCRKPVELESEKGKHGYGVKQCPNCCRVVNSSIKESTGQFVGKKHFHRDIRKGDVV